MRIPPAWGSVVLALLAVSAAAEEASAPARGGTIHGRVRTTGGETLEGSIRWGGSRFWDETLEAREAEPILEEPEGYRFNLFGWTLFDTAEAQRVVHALAVPFGHLRAVEPVKAGGAVLELKNGMRIAVQDAGGDIGGGVDLVVSPAGGGEVELPWRRIVRVEFTSGPRGRPDGERLFGTVKTRAAEFQGFIEWDRDEATAADLLDGEEEGRERRIAFSEIAAIERGGSSSARVTLRSGPTVTLSGTNDVNDDNRGIVVRAPDPYTVVVPWDEFVRVDFRAAPAPATFDRFDGGKPLAGEVRSADGTVRRGPLRWDRDERFSWETLDGDQDGISYRVPFHSIRSISRAGRGGADVVLRDGRTLHLEGSNDVDAGHRGLVIEQDGGAEVLLSWDALVSVELF